MSASSSLAQLCDASIMIDLLFQKRCSLVIARSLSQRFRCSYSGHCRALKHGGLWSWWRTIHRRVQTLKTTARWQAAVGWPEPSILCSLSPLQNVLPFLNGSTSSRSLTSAWYQGVSKTKGRPSYFSWVVVAGNILISIRASEDTES